MTDYAVPVGTTLPLKFVITSDIVNGGIDLTTVTSVTLVNVKRGDGTVAPNWTASLVPAVGQTIVLPTLAIILYLTQPTDLLVKGIWRAGVQLSNSGPINPWPAAPVSWRVTALDGEP